jgi:hypothetical protein
VVMASALGLTAKEIAEEVAQVASVVMADTTDDYAPSLTFPLGYFEREIIERVQIIWGLCRVAVPNVVLQIHFNLDKFPPFADSVRRSLVSAINPLVKGRGGVCQDAPEGVVVILSQDCAIDGDHATEPTGYGSSTPKLNHPVPADHRSQRFPGGVPKKGWTAETAGVPVTDSVEMAGEEIGVGGLVRDIGSGL